MANKVVSPYAYVQFQSNCVPQNYCERDDGLAYTGQIAGTAQIKVNNYIDSTVSVSGAISSALPASLCLKISTKHLHFARQAPVGQSPSIDNGLAGANQIELVFSQATCTTTDAYGGGGPYDCTYDANEQGKYGARSVTFDALAPVIMIHGIGSNGEWFNRFATPFRNAKLPFAQLQFNSEHEIGFGSSGLPSLIVQAANQFGAKHVHIVAHSKGGLWTREFLSSGLTRDATGNNQIGVLSVHTLDTPDHGSVAADISVAAHKGANVDPSFGFTGPALPGTTMTSLVLDLSRKAAEFEDLTVLKMYKYNREHPPGILPEATTIDGRRNSIKYFAYTGDANLNGPVDELGFGIINCVRDPCVIGSSLTPITQVPQLLYTAMQRWKLVTTTRNASGIVTAVSATNSAPYPGNDFVVTVPSAMYSEDKFQTVAPTLFVTHTTVGKEDIGAIVMKRIIAGHSYQ